MAQFFEYEFRSIFHDFDNFPLFNTMFSKQFFNDVLQPNYSGNFHQWHSTVHIGTYDPRREQGDGKNGEIANASGHGVPFGLMVG
jgi:hypothetical protein